MKYINCEICGARVPRTRGVQKYCNECERTKFKTMRLYNYQKKRSKIPNKSVLEDNTNALKIGVSYGKFKAMQKDIAYIEETAKDKRRKNNLNNQKRKRGEK